MKLPSWFQALTGVLVAQLTLAAAITSANSTSPDPRDAFFERVATLCGSSFDGSMTFPPDPEHSFARKQLIAAVAECTESEIRIRFAVGDDRSRTWILTRSDRGLRLKHDHRHEDGTPDEITMYGGWATESGTARSQSFAADEHTAQLIPEAATNVWRLSLSADGRELTYSLERHSEPRFEATLTLRDPE